MSAAALRVPLAAEAIPGVWRGGTRPQALLPTEPTGNRALDAALLGGWPKGALTQVVSRHAGFGFSLILPLLARLTAAGQHAALVHTPFLPCAPALDARGVHLPQLLWVQPETEAKALWAVEQLLRSGLMTAIAFWNAQPLDGNTERRLQLAAETSRCAVFAFRTGAVEAQSYAALKLAVAPAADAQMTVEVVKRRVGQSGQRLSVSNGAFLPGNPSVSFGATSPTFGRRGNSVVAPTRVGEMSRRLLAPAKAGLCQPELSQQRGVLAGFADSHITSHPLSA